MSLKGATQQKIAKHFGVSQSQISRDLNAIHKRRAKANEATLKELRDRELAKLDLIERECWVAWAKSQEPKEVSSQEKTTGGEVDGGDKLKASIRTEGQCGNPAFLKVILDCIKQRASLLGLADAKKMQLDGGKPIQIIEVVAASVQHCPAPQVGISDGPPPQIAQGALLTGPTNCQIGSQRSQPF
ncbi:MAG: hypothetical protein FJ271_30835 [Planctomycetes bacterium]|nr:hypothetical protein [Planctomycetota bacterium]